MAFLKSLFAGFVILAVAMLARPILMRALRISIAGSGPAAPQPAASRPGNAALRPPNPVAGRKPIQAEAPDDMIDAMIDVHRIDGRINAATSKRLAQLLDRHPDLAAQAVRRWLAQGSDSR
jgi:flagellar M-ring protein FliF